MRAYRAWCFVALAAFGGAGCAPDDPIASANGGASSGGSSSAGAGTGAVTAGAPPVVTAGAAGSNSASGTGGQAVGGTPSGGAGGTTGAAGAPGGVSGAGGAAGGAANPHPLIDVLPLFTAPGVPVRGPMESPPKPITYNGAVPDRPGGGLAQHPLLYVGENYNRILMTNQGKVIWTYDTAPGFELDDIWLLSNGNVLYSHMSFAEEITPNKEVVWHYVPPSGEIHAVQPIGLDKVLIGLNQDPTPKIQIINIKTGAVEVEHAMVEGQGGPVHGQMRRMRMTGTGSYLVAFMGLGKVVEYDKDFKVIWTYKTPRPWSVARLHNGNTLIQDETESTCKEVDPQGNTVWSLKRSEIMVAGAQTGGNTQTCERLASGNTVMFFHSSPGNLQAVEVTKAKEVVWALEDWKNLADATSAQFLDEPGIPEVPGATEH